MDRIEFAIATEDLPMGIDDCAEPRLNGRSLVELVREVEERQPLGAGGYAGIAADILLTDLLELLAYAHEDGGRQGAKVLGCSCGDFECSWVSLNIITTPETVTWDYVVGSRFARTPEVYAPIGTFVFDRRRYEHALRTPGERPPRFPPGER